MNKKVLYISSNENIDFQLAYLKKLKENGFSVDILTDKDTKLKYYDRKLRINLNNDIKDNKGVLDKLNKLLEIEHYDAIHTNSLIGATLATLLNKHVKTIYIANNLPIYKGSGLKSWFKYYKILKNTVNNIDTLILMNKEDAMFSKKHFNANIKLINGIEFNKNKFDIMLNDKEKALYKKSLKIKNTDFILVYTSHLDDGAKFILDMLNDLDSNIKLILTGTDYSNGDFKNTIKDLNIKNRVIFLDYKDLNKIYQISDLGLSTNEKAITPTNIATPLFLKVPVIAINSKMNRKYIKNDINGYLIDKDNYSEFIDRINFLQKNKKYSLNLGYNGFNLITDYLLDEVLNIIVNL